MDWGMVDGAVHGHTDVAVVPTLMFQSRIAPVALA